VVGHAPERVTTDGHDSYPRAIRETLGSEVIHRCNRYLNNRLEQDHRGIKQRYYPMRGLGSVASAARFCRALDEVRQFFRVRITMRATGFPCPATRDVPSPIGSFEDDDCHGLTPKHKGRDCPYKSG
jgi:DDE superfamily endonuclease